MKNITFSHRNLHLFFLCLSLFCCLYVTTQSTLTAPPTNHIFELLNSEPGISIFLQQIIEKQDLSLAICIDSSSTLSLEDIDIPLEDVFEKTGSLFRPVRIDELYRNEKIATELLGNGKVHYRVYQVSEVEGHDSGNAFLYQQKKIIGEDNSDHSEIMTSQVYLKLIPLDEAAVEIEQSYRGFGINCAVIEDVDLLASLNLESSFEFLKGGNSILLFISQSDPTNSLKDHEILSSFNNIRKEEVPIKSNVLRINKGTKDHNLLVLDLEETEPITSENTEISTYSTSSKSLIGSDIPVKTSTATLRNLRRLDEAAKKENISPESTLTTWIIVAIVVVVIFLIGVTLAVVAFIKRRRNNSSQQAAYHPQQQVNIANTVHNNRGITGEEATLATHSPPVVRPQQEFMNSEDDIEDPMQENFPCFNNPVRVDDVLRLFEIHFEGYKDNKGGEGTQCDICYDAKKTIMFGPCTHICACEPCAQEVMNVFGKCPLCRTKIEELTYVVKGAS